MVEVAKQAFTTKNFDLAVDVFERLIVENGPSINLYLGLADSYARSGHLRKAFDAYLSAYRLGNVTPENLNHFVTGLVDIMSDNTDLKAIKEQATQSNKEDAFSCGACKSLYCEPVTIQCGHTFCKRCLEKQSNKTCRVCGQVTRYSHFSTLNLKANVLLCQTVESWFSEEAVAGRYKVIGNKHFERNNYQEALEAYSEAFNLAPNDHLIASNRSYAYYQLNKYKEALEDANHCIRIKPPWAKGYFRKAAALCALSQYEEAAFAYLQCLSLDPSISSARSALATSLHKLLSPLQEQQFKHSVLQTRTNPLVQALRSGSYPHDQQQPQLDSSLLQLKLSVQESIQGMNTGTSTSVASHNSFFNVKAKSSEHVQPAFQSSSLQLRKSLSDPCLRTHSSDMKEVSPVSSQRMACSDKLKRKRQQNATQLPLADPVSPTAVNPPKCARSERKCLFEDKLNKDHFECSLCYRLLFHPVTTPCGHSYCRECLDRSLDHSPTCPLCKCSLAEYLAERRSAITESIEKILQLYFPFEYETRKKIFDEEMAELARLGTAEQQEIPLFVCTIAYPKIHCPLHIFEPRYRLMIRRCMESGTRQFGMVTCLEENEKNHASYGTMLEINDVQYFPDGRSVVECIGGRRFKVLERGQHDGYSTAKIEFLKDYAIPEENVQEVKDLHDEVYELSTQWFNSVPHLPRQRILSSFGQFPEAEPNSIILTNGPAWHWWLTAVLPLDPRAQLSILAMTNLKDRLQALKRVIKFVSRENTRNQ